MLTLKLTGGRLAAPSLTVDDNRSIDPATVRVVDDETSETKTFENSKAELNPEGVSTSATWRKLGSPSTERIIFIIL